MSSQVIASQKNAIARRETIRALDLVGNGGGDPWKSRLDHTAKVDVFLGKLLGFLGESGGLSIEVGMLRGWHDGSDVLTIRTCDAGNTEVVAVLKRWM
ncbi:hypothetical protein ABIA06_002542 [Bradyrhizobium yuanmingense]|uniref:hypothetical protein n=1 Tax=Bradyrhizobium yuanmingense TaxID=108015 RepID=UPI0035127F5D